MHNIRHVLAMIVLTAWLMASAIFCVAAPQATASRPAPEVPAGKAFLAFLAEVDAAQLELQNGRPEAFKALWSRADDITLSGGFGGTIEKGWERIGPRLDWVGKQFSNGTNRIDRLVAKAHDDFGYVIQVEHIRFRVPGQAKESTRTYRVTMLFRREPQGWRIIHRQADSQMTKQAPK